MSETPTRAMEELIERLETVVRLQQETIDEHVSNSTSTGATVSVDRRGALQAGGILGLLGLGVTSAGADASGQVGTESRPLETLHAESVESERVDTDILETGAIAGDIAGGESPVTAFSTDASGGSVPVRESGGELAVADASEGDHAVTRGQAVLPGDDVDWSGDHDFDSMPEVGGSPIVENDSNSDGSWVRFADGTQIVHIETEYSGAGSGTNDIFSSEPWPKSFDSTNSVLVSGLQRLDGWHNFDVGHWPFHLDGRQTSNTGRIRAYNVGTSSDLRAWATAFGTWS